MKEGQLTTSKKKDQPKGVNLAEKKGGQSGDE